MLKQSNSQPEDSSTKHTKTDENKIDILPVKSLVKIFLKVLK